MSASGFAPRSIRLALLAGLAVAGADGRPATAAESLVGKTLSGTVRICAQGGRSCSTAKLQAYISGAGRIFDYSGSEAGTVAPFGQWVVNGSRQSRYTLSGNTLTVQSTDGPLEIRGVVRGRGRSCTARYEARLVGSPDRVTVDVLSCDVRDGNQPF